MHFFIILLCRVEPTFENFIFMIWARILKLRIWMLWRTCVRAGELKQICDLKFFFYKFYIIFWEIKGNYKLLKVFACWQYFITSYGTFPWNAPTIGQFYVPFVDIQSFFNYLHTNKYSNGPGNFFNANLKAEFIYSILWDSSFSITFETCDNRVWEKFTLKKTDSTPNTQWDSFTCSSQITVA